MIRVFMGHKDVVDMAYVYIHILQHTQDAVAAARIHHKVFIPVPEGETGVIAMGCLGISCSKHI